MDSLKAIFGIFFMFVSFFVCSIVFVDNNWENDGGNERLHYCD